jgi:hypothetical protein
MKPPRVLWICVIVVAIAALAACGEEADEFAAPVAEATGCEGARLLANPADPSAPGPFPAGVRTLNVNGLVTEVWYPAVRGSQKGKAKASYDLRLQLPPAEQGKIPDAANELQPCDCYRDLPLDETHGPYPVIVFVHGTAAWRSQSAHQAAHWARRGFVVVAQDHPGLKLADVLRMDFSGADQAGDARALFASLVAPAGDLAFLAGHVDVDRRAAAGHSAGGGAVQSLGSEPGVRVLVPMAAGGTVAGASLTSTLVLGALDDSIVRFSDQQAGFAASPPPRRLVGLANAGHLAFSDICALAVKEGGILALAQKYGVEVNPLVALLATDGCLPEQLPPERGWRLINYATSAVLEAELQCSEPARAAQATIAAQPDVAGYDETL